MVNLVAIDAIKFHRFGLVGREPLLLMLAASLLTFAATRLYTRLARSRSWRSGRVGGVHLHHLVVGNVLVLICGMFQLAFQPGDIGVDILSVGFGIGAAFVLDEFALSVHLRDVYWSREGLLSVQLSLGATAILSIAILTLRMLRRGEARQEQEGLIPTGHHHQLTFGTAG